MKKLHRFGALLLSAALCAAFFAGCGREEIPETTAAAESTAAATVSEPTVPMTTVPETIPETTVPETAPLLLPEDRFPVTLAYASGAGGWRTELTLNADGTFTGSYTDAEFGETGEGFPNGTLYFCDFSGRFDRILRADEVSFTMTLAELHTQQPEGEVSIENGTRYVASGAFGITDGTDFTLFLPEAPASVLSEYGSFAWPGNWQDPVPESLGCWALWNSLEDSTFFSYE